MSNDLYGLLGSSFTCTACGRVHAVAVQEVIVAEDALAQLPEVCARASGGRRITLVADEITHEVAGAAAGEALSAARFQVAPIVLPNPVDGHDPICDDHTRARVETQLQATDLFVAVGSGVVNDLTKWIAHDRGVPYIVLGTAASMNGYTSSNIAPTVNNVKMLLYGTCPVAVLAVPSILAAAPPAMTASGFGDVLAKPVSTADWLSASVILDEYYCPFCAGLIDELQHTYLAAPEQIARRTADGLLTLFDALTFAGLAMSMAGTSAPASGAEHMISHTLDMMSLLDGLPHDLHGRKVGVGTIVGAALYEEVFALDAPVFADAGGVTDAAFWGRLSAGVEAEHVRKRAKAARAVRAFDEDRGRWERLRERVRPRLLAPATVKDVLRRAGAAHCLADIGTSRERYISALLHAHEIRDRYTVIDLARAVGVLPERAAELVDRWLLE